VIHTEGLTKQFGSVTAVENLNLDIHEGEVFGFLGPNGAGKTTTVRMLSSLISKTRGSGQVAGCSLGDPADELRLRSQIGLLTENVGLYEGMSAYENLSYFARLYRVDPGRMRENIERLLRMLELWERRDAPVATFSKGMKQKVAIARALVHDPRLLFLDEPTANLDPEAAKTVRDFILELKKERRTIFLNTHHLDEAERICDRVGILRTQLLSVGSPSELKSQIWGGRTKVRMAPLSEAILAAVRARFPGRALEVDGDTMILSVQDPDSENPVLAQTVVAAGGNLIELTQVSASLEDVYLRLVRESEPAT